MAGRGADESGESRWIREQSRPRPEARLRSQKSPQKQSQIAQAYLRGAPKGAASAREVSHTSSRRMPTMRKAGLARLSCAA